MNKDRYDLNSKLEKVCRTNKEMKFLTLCNNFEKDIAFLCMEEVYFTKHSQYTVLQFLFY